MGECTLTITDYLQKKGQATFKELIGDLDLPYRRAADVVNVLDTTPLLKKSKINPRKSPIHFCGTPTMEPFCIKTITEEIEYKKNRILELQHIIQEKQKKIIILIE